MSTEKKKNRKKAVEMATFKLLANILIWAWWWWCFRCDQQRGNPRRLREVPWWDAESKRKCFQRPLGSEKDRPGVSFRAALRGGDGRGRGNRLGKIVGVQKRSSLCQVKTAKRQSHIPNTGTTGNYMQVFKSRYHTHLGRFLHGHILVFALTFFSYLYTRDLPGKALVLKRKYNL